MERYYMKSNGGFVKHKDGNWVKYEDVATLTASCKEKDEIIKNSARNIGRLLKKIEKLEEKNADLSKRITSHLESTGKIIQENSRLRKELAISEMDRIAVFNHSEKPKEVCGCEHSRPKKPKSNHCAYCLKLIKE